MVKNRMTKRPNGSGTVVKLSGKRRKPFMAKITIGFDPITGNQQQKAIGYFETRQEALNALSIYDMSNNNDFKPVLGSIGGDTYNSVMAFKNRDLPTFSDIYNGIKQTQFIHLSISRQKAYDSAFKRLEQVHDKTINSITLFDLQACIDESKKEVKQKTLCDMKTICVKVFEYAIIHQYISRDCDYTAYIDTKQATHTITPPKHKTLAISDILTIKGMNEIIYKVIMVYLLTGCRPNELMGLNKKAVHLDEQSSDDGKNCLISYIVTGSKTESGKNRIIPIHNTIKPYIKEALRYLKDMTVAEYRIEFKKALNAMGLEYLPYDTRHTFATLAKLYNMDDFTRKRIMGHKSQNLTDDTYTHTIKNKLFNEIQKIKI